MHSSTIRDAASFEPVVQDSDLQGLADVIEHAGDLLPAQGPITVFIHHNTLHAFEDLPFNEAAMKGAADLFGCQPYLSEDHSSAQELMRRADPVCRVEGGRWSKTWETGRAARASQLWHAAGPASGDAPESLA